jgi:hypothetical protein
LWVINKLANLLPTWKGTLLDLVGRAVLLKAVLTAMTIYCMMALDFLVWMISPLEGLYRGFCGVTNLRLREGHAP